MRIAYFLTWHDGVGRGVLEKVSDQVSFWISEGHSVRVFVVTHHTSRNDFQYAVSGSRVRGFRTSLGSIVAQGQALKDLKTFAPDIIYLRPSLRNLWLLRFFPTVPLIAEVQTNDLVESRLKSRLRFILTRFARRSLNRAHGLVFVSNELARAPEFASFSPTRITIGNGIDLSRVAAGAHRSLDGPPSLLFLGSSGVPWHGLDHLLSLAQERPDWHFHIVGDLADQSVRSPNVFFHGSKDARQIRALAGNVDLGVGPLGLYRKGMEEASPLKVRHYLALGLPVVGAYRDTDIDAACDYFLQIPNNAGGLSQSVDLIEDFVRQWRGLRVDPLRVQLIDAAKKEAMRLEFFHRVLDKSQLVNADVC